MKKILKYFLVLIAILGIPFALTSCKKDDGKTADETEQVPESLKTAKEYLQNLYKNESSSFTKDLTKPTSFGTDTGVSFTWTVDNSNATVTTNSNGTVTISADTFTTEAYSFVLKVKIQKGEESYEMTWNKNVTAFATNTYAEIVAASDDATIGYQGVLVGKTNAPEFGDSSYVTYVFIQGTDGAVMPYKYSCTTQAEYDALVLGGTYLVKGTKDTYYGVIELTNCTLKRVGETVSTITYKDITSELTELGSSATNEQKKALCLKYFGQPVKVSGVFATESENSKYLRFESNGYKGYFYLSTTASSNFYDATNEQSLKDGWLIGSKYDVQGILYYYMSGESYDFYLFPDDTGSYTKLAATNKELVDNFLNSWSVSTVMMDGSYTLPTNDDYTVSYELDSANTATKATIADGKLVVADLGTAEETVKLKVTVTCSKDSGSDANTQTTTKEVSLKGVAAKTISEFIAAKDTSNYYKLTGTVVAVNAVDSTGSFVLQDASGSIFSYTGANVVLGHKYNFTGLYSENNGLPQFKNVTALDLGESADYESYIGAAVSYTASGIKTNIADSESTDIIADYSNKCLKIQGFIKKSGNYTNLYATADDTSYTVSLYAAKTLNIANYTGIEMYVYGYLRGTNKSKSSITVQVTKIEFVNANDSTTYISVQDEVSIEVDDETTLDVSKRGYYDGTDELTWTFASADSTVASVDTNGMISALKAGSTTITITPSAGSAVTVDVIVTEVEKIWTANENVTIDFADDTTYSTWGGSYVQRNEKAKDVKITFVSANKQNSGNEIDDVPVSKGQPLIITPTGAADIQKIKVTFKQWGSKGQTIKCSYSLDGTNYIELSATSTNFEYEADLSSIEGNVVSIKFTFSSSSNQIGFKSAELTINPATTE